MTGLRARLLVAFVCVTVTGAVAAAWASATSASAALLTGTEEQLTAAVAGRITAVAPELTFPPDQSALDRLHAAVGPEALIIYGSLRSGDETAAGADPVRDRVRSGDRLVAQRVVEDGRPWLMIGTPVVVTTPDGARSASGIEVYVARDLTAVDRQVDGLTRSAAATTVLALPLSVLLALAAASSVLRPVRRLRDTARRLAAGDLDARAVPRGKDELTDLTITLNEMAGALQQSMARMERMQADVSHELRTPLATLTAVMDVLESATGDMEPDAQESARMAVTEVGRLTRLVEDLIEVSRFDAGTARLHLEDTDLARTVHDCLLARGWSGDVVVETVTAVRARVDRRRIDVIVANLAGNALKHGRKPVRIRISADPGHALVSVTDSGPGLPDEVLPHVFERFYKRDPSRGRTPGSGLGLAIAAENARLHGGDLTAGNAAGGACFVLRLPLGREEDR